MTRKRTDAMDILALNPAQTPSPSGYAFELAVARRKSSATERDARLLPRDLGDPIEVGLPARWLCGNQFEDVQKCVPNYESRLMLGHCFGAKPAPCGSASFCFPGASQDKFEDRGKRRRTNFSRAPPRKHSLALGSRAHSLGSA
jgi:hypothetical protein